MAIALQAFPTKPVMVMYVGVGIGLLCTMLRTTHHAVTMHVGEKVRLWIPIT